MIINTGQRTDIPAFYAEWFANRLKAGSVCVRNPFDPQQVSRYRLDPEVVDVIAFCSKNPAPMLAYMDLLKEYAQYWHVTITPYGKDLEPNVPDPWQVIRTFQRISDIVGPKAICWRYDPILLLEGESGYTVPFHLEAFARMAAALEGYTDTVVISFLDMYQKVTRNFPEARPVPRPARVELAQKIIEMAGEHGMAVRPCGEGSWMEPLGAACRGCNTIRMYEQAIGKRLKVPRFQPAREQCACYLSCDIGAYDSCPHLCRYCYANSDAERVRIQRSQHDPHSPFLIGGPLPSDRITDAVQESWVDPQISLFDL